MSDANDANDARSEETALYIWIVPDGEMASETVERIRSYETRSRHRLPYEQLKRLETPLASLMGTRWVNLWTGGRVLIERIRRNAQGQFLPGGLVETTGYTTEITEWHNDAGAHGAMVAEHWIALDLLSPQAQLSWYVYAAEQVHEHMHRLDRQIAWLDTHEKGKGSNTYAANRNSYKRQLKDVLVKLAARQREAEEFAVAHGLPIPRWSAANGETIAGHEQGAAISQPTLL